jgi:two-component system, sensor histidine kinase and response regulator
MKEKKILIVDDELNNIKFAMSILSKNKKYNLYYSETGNEALKQVKKIKFDLILLDIVLPDIYGYNLCKDIHHKDGINAETPVIFITGKDDEKSMLKSFASGGHDYITKPFRSSELLARVEHTLELFDIKNNLQFLVDDKTNELQKVNEQLNKKIVAMQEMFDMIENNKNIFYEQISDSINLRIMPVISKIKNKLDNKNSKLADILSEKINELTGPLSKSLNNILRQLSGRELDICELIRSNLTTKEIAKQLYISIDTVKYHRNNIRKKLNLTKKENLKLFLSNL